jgi:hypothetical protein
MTALDSATQPGRLARSRDARAPAPPPRRSGGPRPADAALSTVSAFPVPTPTWTRPRPVPAPAAAPVDRPRRTWIGWLVAALVAGLVTGGTLAALGVNVVPSHADPSTATIVSTVQHLGVVTLPAHEVTTTFTVDDGNSLPGFSNRATYHAVGTETASVDLSKVRAADVEIVGGATHLTIPAAQLGTPVLDTGLSSVNHRDEGFVTKNLLGDGVSLGELHGQARSEVATAATTQGIPTAAEQLAASEVRNALRRAGITNVTVTAAGS